MKYILYRYIPQNDAWYAYQTFETREKLIAYLALGTSTGYNGKRAHWTNMYIDNQNVTCKDVTVNYRVVAKRDENGNIIRDKNDLPVYESVCDRNLREWHLEDDNGRTIDMRLFKEEVYDIVEKMSESGRQLIFLRRILSRRKPDRRQGRPRHHTGHYRCSPHHHRYTRTINAPDAPEDVDEILTSQQIQRLKTKPKDKYARFMWGDDFWTYGPTGWKEHKNRKQWEARVKRNSDTTWVDNKSNKKTIAFELNKNEPADNSAGHCFFSFLSNTNYCCRFQQYCNAVIINWHYIIHTK